MTLGEKIKSRRKALKMSARQLSRKSGIAENSIYSYERDEHDPSFFAVTCLAEALNVSLDYLAGREGTSLDKKI